MRPSVLFTLVIAFCCSNCNDENDAPLITPPVKFISISDVTTSSAKFSLAMGGPVVQQNDTSFFVNGFNLEKVGFAYTTDPGLHISGWDTIFVKPAIASVISVIVPDLQANTRYRVKAVALFRISVYQRTHQQQVLEGFFGKETLEFQTN